MNLARMKIVRGDRQDEDVIAEIHARHPQGRGRAREQFT
jgi:hypothetical protein